MGPQTDRPPLTRDTVVAAARALILDEGLEAVSFRRLAQRVGVTAPALYAYVDDKDDLLRSVTRREFIQLIERFQRPEGEDPVESLRRFCHRYVDYATSHPALYRTMFLFPPWEHGASTGGDFGLPISFEQFAVPYQAAVEAIDSGRFRECHPLIAVLTLWTTMHGLADILLLGMPGGTDAAREAFADQVIDAALDGLRPRSGPAGPAGGAQGSAA